MNEIDKMIRDAWNSYWLAVGAGKPAQALIHRDRVNRLERMQRSRKSTQTMLAPVIRGGK